MKSLLTAIALVATATAATAGNSDRYNDLRLDTSEKSQTFAGNTQGDALPEGSTRANDLRLDTSDDQADVSFSARDGRGTKGEGYIYGGFGPGNDSR